MPAYGVVRLVFKVLALLPSIALDKSLLVFLYYRHMEAWKHGVALFFQLLQSFGVPFSETLKMDVSMLDILMTSRYQSEITR